MRLAARKEPPKPLAERGRMLFIRDVQELFGKDDAGNYRKSAWWVRTKFAPDHKHKLGRDPYWWETQALEWLDNQREGAA